MFEKGFTVVLPEFEGDPAAMQQTNDENLRSADAVLIYYGSGDDNWFKIIDNALKGISAIGKARPLIAKAVLFAEPATSKKKNFFYQGYSKINALEGFDNALLDTFISTMNTH